MPSSAPYAQISAIYALAVRVGLGLTLLWSSRRAFGLWIGLPISLLAALLLPLAPIVAIALIWCLVALGPDSPERVRLLFPYLVGPVAAIETLDKLSIGPVILLIGAITVLAMEGRRLRNVLAFAGTFVVALISLWLSLGQGVADIGQYLRSGYEIVSGYSTAMVAAGENDESAHIVAFAGMTAAALAAGYVATRRLPPIRRVAVALVLALASFAAWKMAFVRFGLPTVPYLFTAAIPAWFAFPWRRLDLPGPFTRVNGVALGLAGFAVVAVLYFPLTQEPLSTLDPSRRLSRADEQLRELLSPDRRARTREESRALLTASFPLDRRTLALLKGHTVDIDQADIAVAWAYGLDWLPLPTFQAYAAYTPYLDRQNREALLAADGPSRILRLSSVTPSAMLKTNPAEVQSLNFLSDANARPAGLEPAGNHPGDALQLQAAADDARRPGARAERGPLRCAATPEDGERRLRRGNPRSGAARQADPRLRRRRRARRQWLGAPPHDALPGAPVPRHPQRGAPVHRRAGAGP